VVSLTRLKRRCWKQLDGFVAQALAPLSEMWAVSWVSPRLHPDRCDRGRRRVGQASWTTMPRGQRGKEDGRSEVVRHL